MKRLRVAYSDRVGAGASAEARYRTLLRSWRARNHIFILLTVVPIVVWVLACALLWPAHRGSYASFGIGAASVLYIAVRLLLVPAHIERWRDGAETEKQTAKQLRPLLRDAHWTAVHDRASRYGNRDHVVVGPSGVYLLDTKAPVGIVSVKSGVMTVRRREDPEDLYEQHSLAGRMRGAAAELADDLGRATGQRPWVTPVVVIWAPFEQHAIEDGGVLWVHGKALREWLASQEAKLADGRREQLAQAVEALPSVACAPEPPGHLPIETSRT
jgi:Nuclease-related domain